MSLPEVRHKPQYAAPTELAPILDIESYKDFAPTERTVAKRAKLAFRWLLY